MKKINLTLLLFTLLFTTQVGFAQKETALDIAEEDFSSVTKSPSKVYLQKQMRKVAFQNSSLNANNFFAQQATKMGLTSPSEMKRTKTLTGENGYQHVRYQQIYQSVPVFGTAYTLHEKNGIVTHAGGYYLPLVDLEVRPQITPEHALQNAMQKMGAKRYAFEDTQNESAAFPESRPVPELVIIDRAFPQFSEHYALAYRVVLTSSEPFDKREYFIDAHSGIALLNLPLHLHNAVPAQGVTKYYGTQTITVDSISPNEFLLRDPSRNGNTTFDGSQLVWSNSSNDWDFTNEAQDEVAIDAHYCTQEFYDFMLEELNWNGLDNDGLPMNILVHAGNGFGAFWNGQYAAFGDGDCNHGPLTTLEVVGHEFTHGITENTSELVYSGESGAINESMSDIFGKALQFYTTPDDFNWDLGASYIETPYAEPVRSFSDPNSLEHPKFYKGTFWEDDGDVHINSSVGNHWFYQMVNGGSGVNELGEPYDIEALGMDKAIQIVFLTQKAYLTSTSTYDFYYESSLLAAEELYGPDAPEIQSVVEAWKVVGLPYSLDTGEDILDLSVSFSGIFVGTCLNSEFYDAEVTVANVGQLPYTPNLNASIMIDGGATSEEIIIEESIAPGESVVYQFEDYLFFDTGDQENITADLMIADGNAQNNSTSQFVINALYTDNDLGILVPQFPELNCVSNLQDVFFYVYNDACNPLLAGTTYTIQIDNPTTGYTWSKIYTLDSNLGRAQFQITQETLDLEPSGDYILTLNLSGDVNLENNKQFFGSSMVSPIVGAYDNNMDVEDPSLVLSSGNYPYDYLNIDGNNVLAISSDSPGAQYLCPEVEDNFISSFFNVTQNLSFCADLTDMDNPILGFDLTQFRNPDAIAFSELEEYGAIFKASWKDASEEYSQIIVGQPEGVSQHYDLPLPSGFVGKVQFDFFHNTGDFDAEDFLDYDVSLFDNLTLSENLVNIKDVNTLLLKIHPNPSNGLLTLTHPEAPKNLVLCNAQGQILRTLNQSDNMSQLDISDLPGGYYFLTIGYGDFGQVTKGVVKMSE